MDIIDFVNPNKPVYSVKAHNEIINAIDGVGGLNIGKGNIFVFWHCCIFKVFYQVYLKIYIFSTL